MLSRSLSLGDAPFLRRSPEETNVCQRGKAAKLCLSDVRNPVWRTSDYDAAIWPLFVAWFARDLRHCLEKRTTTYLESPHSIRDDISRSPRATTSGVCRVRWEKAFPDPELHTRGRHFTIDCRKQWKLLSERAWHAWQTHTLRANGTEHFAPTITSETQLSLAATQRPHHDSCLIGWPQLALI